MNLNRGSDGSWFDSTAGSWSDQKLMNLAAFEGKPEKIWDPVVPLTTGFTITIYVETC